MSSSLAGMLQLLEDETFQSVVHVKVARHSHVGHEAHVDFVFSVILLLNELASLKGKR